MEQIKSLIFEFYSAGFEAGMNGKDIVSAYNEFFDNNIKPELIKYT